MTKPKDQIPMTNWKGQILCRVCFTWRQAIGTYKREVAQHDMMHGTIDEHWKEPCRGSHELGAVQSLQTGKVTGRRYPRKLPRKRRVKPQTCRNGKLLHNWGRV